MAETDPIKAVDRECVGGQFADCRVQHGLSPAGVTRHAMTRRVIGDGWR
jgi:hypothetical protein